MKSGIIEQLIGTNDLLKIICTDKYYAQKNNNFINYDESPEASETMNGIITLNNEKIGDFYELKINHFYYKEPTATINSISLSITNQGIGTKVMKLLTDYSRSRGMKQIVLEEVINVELMEHIGNKLSLKQETEGDYLIWQL
ncbi:MAG: hypothetical protein WC307_01305 [Candidatus Nanoarchaeia archaeon]|jgi:hypothetical protein